MSAKFQIDNYIPVSERLEQFYSDHPEGRILTSIVEHNEETGFVLMRAEAYRKQEDTVPAATGHAYETRGEGYINKTSHIENCETSAVGRALALLGYEIKRGIASREEMQKVERMSTPLQAVKPVTERDVLIEGVKDAFKLLNKAGDVPPWTPKLMNEFAVKNFGVKVDDLELEPLRDLIKKLSLRLDDVKKENPVAGRQQEGPYCDCGIARVRVDGTAKTGPNKGQPYAMWVCANRVKEHKNIFINLDEEREAETVQHQDESEPEETDDGVPF